MLRFAVENYYLMSLMFTGLYVTTFLMYLTRFSPEDPRTGAFQRLLLGVLMWAFFDMSVSHVGRLYTPEAARLTYRCLSFMFLFYAAAACEMIIALITAVTWRHRTLLYIPYILLYLAGLAFPDLVSAGTFGVPDDAHIRPIWNLTFKVYTVILTAYLLLRLLFKALRQEDRLDRQAELALFMGGSATLAGIAVSQLLRVQFGPGFPWTANIATFFTALAAFWGIRRYGRLFSPQFLYSATVHMIPSGLVHIKGGRITWSNPSMAELMGAPTPERLNGLPAMDFLYPPDQHGAESDICKTLVRDRLKDRELVLQALNGKLVHCLVSSAPLDPKKPEHGSLAVFQNITDLKLSEKRKEELIVELQKALADVKTLGGLLPICSNCKKIRDDKGYWNQIEEYIHRHSEAEFSHSICPDCAKKLYPELLDH